MVLSIKTCKGCGEAKPLSAFYAHPQMKDGHLNKCIECAKATVAARRTVKGDEIREYDRKRNKAPARKALIKSYEGPLQRKQRHDRYKAKYPERETARNAVNNAVRDGRLIKQPCEVCGELKVEAHHEDYSKPLEVRWLCVRHHADTRLRYCDSATVYS